MNVTNIGKAKEWFEVLQTGERSQSAMMTLEPDQSTGDRAEAHERSDQVLLMLEGELTGQVGNEYPSLKQGDVINYSSRCETSLYESRQEAGGHF